MQISKIVSALAIVGLTNVAAAPTGFALTGCTNFAGVQQPVDQNNG